MAESASILFFVEIWPVLKISEKVLGLLKLSFKVDKSASNFEFTGPITSEYWDVKMEAHIIWRSSLAKDHLEKMAWKMSQSNDPRKTSITYDFVHIFCLSNRKTSQFTPHT